MNFKLLLTLCAALIFSLSQAQTKISKIKTVSPQKAIRKQLCVNDTYYSLQQMQSMKPFADAAVVKLVSYSKFHHSKKTDVFLSIMNHGKIDTANLSQKIILDTAQVNMLANILFNYGNKVLPAPSVSGCFVPYDAILFYDKSGNIISCIEISFGCETIMKFPADLNIGSNCSMKFDMLRSFFEKAGITYFGDFD